MNKSLKKNQIVVIVLAVLVSLLYVGYLIVSYLNYVNFEIDRQFGYHDPQNYWKSLFDLWEGKVLYKEFFWTYGLLGLIVRLPLFLISGKTFFWSVVVNNYIFLPLLGIAMSFLIGKQLLKGIGLSVFLFLLLLYGVNVNFESFRYLVPALGLILTLVGIETRNDKKITYGSIALGLSIWGSIEYAFFAFVSLFLYIFIQALNRKIEFVKTTFHSFLIPVISGAFFLSYLFFNNAFNQFVDLYKAHSYGYYFLSACVSGFLRMDIIESFVGFVSRIQYYVIPISIVILIIWLFFYRKKSFIPVIISALVFSLFSFIRPLQNPCDVYLAFALSLYFLSCVYLVFSKHTPSKVIKWFCSGLLIWLIFGGFFNDNIKSFISSTIFKQGLNKEVRQYMPIADFRMSKDVAQGYNQVVEYIRTNSSPSDYIYDYPNGAYYLLSDRKPAVSVAFNHLYLIMPSLINYSYKELISNPPKLVIVNRFNTINVGSALVGMPVQFFSSGDQILIESMNTKIEQYIMDNYVIDKKFKMAWVLKRKDVQAKTDFYVPVEDKKAWYIQTGGVELVPNWDDYDDLVYKINDHESTINFLPKNDGLLAQVDLIKIPIKVDLGPTKFISKFLVEITGVGNGYIYTLNRIFIGGDWQDIWFHTPRIYGEGSVDSIKLRITRNYGFLPFGTPKSITIKYPSLYMRNPDLQIEDTAISRW